MLTELTIENFALVEKQRLVFGDGLNILTGETGAGKSILLDALGMALGERVSADTVRFGSEKARVEAIFTLNSDDTRLSESLNAAGIESDDDLLLVTRELNTNGKNAIRINGRPATLGMLKSIGDFLVDIHGQHEHQSLLDSARHADILDNWCGDAIFPLKEAVATAFQERQQIAAELDALRSDARERARTVDILRFQCDDIKTVNPQPDEEENLLQERTLLASAEKLYAATSSATSALRGDENGGAADALAKAIRALEPIAAIDESLLPTLEMLQSAQVAAEEGARDLRDYRDRVEFNPERLEQVETRIGALKTLLRKYGEDIPTVLRYRDEITARLDALENSEERIAELVERLKSADGTVQAHCANLTQSRREAAAPFAQSIQRELTDLAMSAARFDVSFQPRPITAKGADTIEFLFSANPGEPLRPLAKIASGGEISRVMLAMKSVLARTLALPTLVFDEIDSGIGGRTGVVIADKLAALGRTAQVLCITHLPQIAARGKTHFAIEKHVEANRTVISVSVLPPEERVHEIARMLGGDGETVLRHAQEMLAAK